MARPNTYALTTVSAFTGRPIVAFFSGFTRPSSNTKTGPMIQVHLLDLAADLRHGPSVSMCGGCIRRPSALPKIIARRIALGLKPCYVSWSRAPHAITKAYKNGRIPDVDWITLLKLLRSKGFPTRLGASGDPIHLGVDRIAQIASTVEITGYTRAWRMPAMQAAARYLMASADTMDDARDASFMGWMAFRARPEGSGLLPNEVQCPAAAEAGHAMRCIDCLKCGKPLVSVSIIEH